MNSKFSIVKTIVVAAALAAGISAMARADDSSMNPFTGDSYAYFNGGNLPKIGNPVYDKSPSSWRQSNPNGLSESQFQALSSWGPAWHQPNQSATSALASTNDATSMPSASREHFGAWIARFFHLTPADQVTPAN